MKSDNQTCQLLVRDTRRVRGSPPLAARHARRRQWSAANATRGTCWWASKGKHTFKTSEDRTRHIIAGDRSCTKRVAVPKTARGACWRAWEGKCSVQTNQERGWYVTRGELVERKPMSRADDQGRGATRLFVCLCADVLLRCVAGLTWERMHAYACRWEEV